MIKFIFLVVFSIWFYNWCFMPLVEFISRKLHKLFYKDDIDND